MKMINLLMYVLYQNKCFVFVISGNLTRYLTKTCFPSRNINITGKVSIVDLGSLF